MKMGEFLRNRAAVALEVLEKYRGEWVAWSPDGIRIVASARNLEDLDALVEAAGEDPAECVMGSIPNEDCVIGGSWWV